MNYSSRDPETVKQYLQGEDAHRKWISMYRGPENEPFYDLALDYTCKKMGLKSSDTIVDFGCGSARHAIRLAKRGFSVQGFDFSESAIDLARAAVAEARLSECISVSPGDLTKLPLPDNSVRFGFCWGVLMHVPQVETAVSELSRVLSPGGVLLVSEGNSRSLVRSLFRTARVVMRKGVQPTHVPAGYEYWSEEAGGALVTRESDIGWLRRAFEARGLQLFQRHSGEFSELYSRFQSRAARKIVHSFNRAWFRLDPLPSLASANMLFFRKDG